MVKHWILEHPQEKEQPAFKFKIVASFQDSLTRQIAESVRIDRRGGMVLNSKTEYSRCSLPRLTVDLEEWKSQKEAMMKSEKAREKIESEKQREAEESIMAECTAGIEKRKASEATEAGGRRKKRRKLEPLTEWGEHPVEVGVEEARNWLNQPVEKDLDTAGGSKQMRITAYTVGVQELLRRRADDWVQRCLLEDVWKTVELKAEVHGSVRALEIDLETCVEMAVPGNDGGDASEASGQRSRSSMELEKIGLKSRCRQKKPMTKPVSRKKKKEKEFQDLINRTRKMTGWRIERGVRTECGTAELNGCNASQLITHNQNLDITSRIIQTNNFICKGQ